MSEEPICVARRMRWASPPESVPAERERVRYSRPTSHRKPRRLSISLRIWRAMRSSFSVRVSWERKLRALRTERSDSAAMFSPPTVTASDTGFRRWPRQSGQGMLDM